MDKEYFVTKEYLVTIPLDLYNELLEIRFEKARVEESLETLLEKAELSWDNERLVFNDDEMRDFVKSVSLVAYERRLEELKKEEKKDE